MNEADVWNIFRPGRGGRPRWHLDESGCWLWVGGKGRHGYGLISLRVGGRKTSKQAHRWVYEQMHGPLSDDLVLDHRCEVKACVRPSHCEPVFQAVNVHRGRRSKRTEAEVIQIRQMAQLGARECDIARQFDIPQQSVNHIIHRRTWKDVA